MNDNVLIIKGNIVAFCESYYRVHGVMLKYTQVYRDCYRIDYSL